MDEKNDTSVRKMAELLRQGATMLADACPQCGSPLFKVKDDIYCAKCDRRIVYAQSDEEAVSHAVQNLIPELRTTLIAKLKTLTDVISAETDTDALTKLANLMVLLLQALHRLENMNQ